MLKIIYMFAKYQYEKIISLELINNIIIIMSIIHTINRESSNSMDSFNSFESNVNSIGTSMDSMIIFNSDKSMNYSFSSDNTKKPTLKRAQISGLLQKNIGSIEAIYESKHNLEYFLLNEDIKTERSSNIYDIQMPKCSKCTKDLIGTDIYFCNDVTYCYDCSPWKLNNPQKSKPNIPIPIPIYSPSISINLE